MCRYVDCVQSRLSLHYWFEATTVFRRSSCQFESGLDLARGGRCSLGFCFYAWSRTDILATRGRSEIQSSSWFQAGRGATWWLLQHCCLSLLKCIWRDLHTNRISMQIQALETAPGRRGWFVIVLSIQVKFRFGNRIFTTESLCCSDLSTIEKVADLS